MLGRGDAAVALLHELAETRARLLGQSLEFARVLVDDRLGHVVALGVFGHEHKVALELFERLVRGGLESLGDRFQVDRILDGLVVVGIELLRGWQTRGM